MKRTPNHLILPTVTSPFVRRCFPVPSQRLLLPAMHQVQLTGGASVHVPRLCPLLENIWKGKEASAALYHQPAAAAAAMNEQAPHNVLCFSHSRSSLFTEQNTSPIEYRMLVDLSLVPCTPLLTLINCVQQKQQLLPSTARLDIHILCIARQSLGIPQRPAHHLDIPPVGKGSHRHWRST